MISFYPVLALAKILGKYYNISGEKKTVSVSESTVYLT
jgi:hypothetical protein